jgi:hypothetical protein
LFHHLFMSLRILHTADSHIGLSFNQYPEATRERLIDERFASLERMACLSFVDSNPKGIAPIRLPNSQSLMKS